MKGGKGVLAVGFESDSGQGNLAVDVEDEGRTGRTSCGRGGAGMCPTREF